MLALASVNLGEHYIVHIPSWPCASSEIRSNLGFVAHKICWETIWILVLLVNQVWCLFFLSIHFQTTIKVDRNLLDVR